MNDASIFDDFLSGCVFSCCSTGKGIPTQARSFRRVRNGDNRHRLRDQRISHSIQSSSIYSCKTIIIVILLYYHCLFGCLYFDLYQPTPYDAKRRMINTVYSYVVPRKRWVCTLRGQRRSFRMLVKHRSRPLWTCRASQSSQLTASLTWAVGSQIHSSDRSSIEISRRIGIASNVKEPRDQCMATKLNLSTNMRLDNTLVNVT